MYAKEEKIYSTYILKHSSNRETQVILLMISNGEKQWHYLSIKKILALFRRITSKNNGDIFCLNCLHSFRTKTKLELHKKVCENKIFAM